MTHIDVPLEVLARYVSAAKAIVSEDKLELDLDVVCIGIHTEWEETRYAHYLVLTARSRLRYAREGYDFVVHIQISENDCGDIVYLADYKIFGSVIEFLENILYPRVTKALGARKEDLVARRDELTASIDYIDRLVYKAEKAKEKSDE